MGGLILLGLVGLLLYRRRKKNSRAWSEPPPVDYKPVVDAYAHESHDSRPPAELEPERPLAELYPDTVPDQPPAELPVPPTPLEREKRLQGGL